MSHVTCHVSHFTCHMSRVTFHRTTILCSFSCYESPRSLGGTAAGRLVIDSVKKIHLNFSQNIFFIKSFLGNCRKNRNPESWTLLQNLEPLFEQTRCSRGCSTNIFVTHSFIDSFSHPFPPNLQNIITPKP